MGTIVVPVFQVFSDGDPQLPLGSEDHLVQTPRLDGPDEILLAILLQIDSLLPQNWDLQPTLKYPGKATQTRL